MGAVKELMGEMGAKGVVPIDAAMLRRMRKLAGPIKTVTVEVKVRGQKGRERGLPADEARRLAEDGRLLPSDRDSLEWSMRVCGVARVNRCPDCGGDSITYLVEACMIDGKLVVNNADEPEGPTFRPLSRCEDCEAIVPVVPPAWTRRHRHDALAAFNGPGLRDALAALHRAAVEAGVSGEAVEQAARRLRGSEVEPHDPLVGYRQRTAERDKRLDALEKRCRWGDSAPGLGIDAMKAREQWQRVMNEQGADEIANGL